MIRGNRKVAFFYMNKVIASILCGGKNLRFHSEKSLITINGKPIIMNCSFLLEQIFPELIINTNKIEIIDLFSHKHHLIDDIFKHKGPLSGIHASLDALSENSDAVFIFACDMPSLNKGLILRQLKYWKKHCKDFDALVPSHVEGFEPLHAIYRKTCLQAISEQIIKNDLRVKSFYKSIKIKYFQVHEYEIFSFFNINTRHDLKKIQTQIVE